MRELWIKRELWINMHLWVAAFFTPVLLIIAISGGLYLVGIKGTTVDTASVMGRFASSTIFNG